jgi:hypothetical protein
MRVNCTNAVRQQQVSRTKRSRINSGPTRTPSALRPHRVQAMSATITTPPQPTTTNRSISPSRRDAIAPEYTVEQVEAASRPPSLESIFTAHLRLLALQDAESHELDR